MATVTDEYVLRGEDRTRGAFNKAEVNSSH